MLSIIVVTLAYVIGIAWGLYLEFEILVTALFFLFVLLLMIIILNKKFINISKYFISIILLSLIFLSGYFYTMHKISIYTNKYNEGEMSFKCTTISHVAESEYYYKYFAKNEIGDKFQIYIKKTSDAVFEIGTILDIKGDFELPDVARNKGGFNYRQYLNSNNVYGIVKVTNYSKCTDSNNNIIYKLQNIIRNNFLKIFPKDYAGILNGMLIGETSDISDEVSTYFEKSGITHLLAVSGSNVALVIAIAEFVFAKLVGKKFSPYFEILFIIFFVTIAGASASVVRAGIMAILSILANIFVRKSNSINNVFTSALLILLVNPITLANVGFILSFVGTLRNNINLKNNKRKTR